MSQYTFQFNDLAAYASAKASGGSIATALSGVSSTDISRSVVSYIKGIGQAVTDSVNLFVPYAKGGLAGDVLCYTGTEYCWLKSPSDALDGSVLGQNIINTSAIPTSWVRVGAVPTSESKDVQIGMQAYQPGAAMVKVEKLLGNSVAWNQKMHNLADCNATYGTKTVIGSNEVLITPNGAKKNASIIYTDGEYMSTGHKYYVSVYLKAETAGTYQFIFPDWGFTSFFTVAVPATSYTRVSFVGTVNNIYATTYYGITKRLDATPFYVKDLIFIDLTLMFGESVANTMTVEMFEKLFPLPYYEYNPGDIISNEAAAVKGVGFNQWDEEWEVGTIATSSGQNINSTTDCRSKNYIPILSASQYYIVNLGIANSFIVFYYRADKTYLSYANLSSGKINNYDFTTPEGAVFMRFVAYQASTNYGTTYNHDICINLSGPLNGTYEPYKESIAKLDAKKIYGKLNGTGNYVQVFPDGIRSAGTAFDEVDYQSRSAVVRVDSVDLGTLTWSDYSINSFRSITLSNLGIKFPSKGATLQNIICVRYLAASSYNDTTDKRVAIFSANGTNQMVIKDSAYSDAATFKTAMQGVELLYELATPVYYTDLKLSDDGVTFHDLPRPFYYTAGLEMKDPQDTASSVTAPARILASYKPIKK